MLRHVLSPFRRKVPLPTPHHPSTSTKILLILYCIQETVDRNYTKLNIGDSSELVSKWFLHINFIMRAIYKPLDNSWV